jgi:hypothetical protein
VVTAVLFANATAPTGLGFSDFGVVAMAKIRETAFADLTPTPINVHSGVPATRQCAESWENENKLEGVTSWPFRLENAYD